jgi:hypothetical protein
LSNLLKLIPIYQMILKLLYELNLNVRYFLEEFLDPELF